MPIDRMNNCSLPAITNIYICMACDERYAEILGVSLASIAQNKAADDSVYIYVIDCGISFKSKERITRYFQANHNFHVFFISIDLEQFSVFKKDLEKSHISISTYSRLLLSSLLPSNIKKVIYLDCDTIVRTSLQDLFCTEMQTDTMGVRDVLEPYNTQRLKLSKYVNAGVLLIDLEKWRQEKTEAKLLFFALNKIGQLKYFDQDVINVVLQDRISYLDVLWNAQTSPYPGSSKQNRYAKTAHIIHFVSDLKPWVSNINHPFQAEWFKYRKRSPWFDSDFLFWPSKVTNNSIKWKCYYVVSSTVNALLPPFLKWKIKKLLRIKE